MKKVLVGMSGGIDSSVAAALLKRDGYEVEGVTMLIWKKEYNFPVPAHSNSCFNPERDEDIEEIKRICDKIGIVHHVVDLSDLYQQIVLENFKKEYMSGRTPNPCIHCNAKIKFGAMVDAARDYFDFDLFATGHYARIVKGDNGRYQLMRAIDAKKDQSYFLSRLSQEQLSKTLFPLGSSYKKDIRVIDQELGFHRPDMDESQDFYSGDYTDLLEVSNRKGNIVLQDTGEVLNTHNGFWHYTVGQRKGLGIAYPEPLYVLSVDSVRNIVYVGPERETYKDSITARDINYVGESGIEDGKIYSVKVRSTSLGDAAYVKEENGVLTITFLGKIRSIASGQSAVIYDNDRVIASAIID